MKAADQPRENWGSRAGFILAAIGSAVGLGNVWRFPHEAYSHGGSAFLIPYMVAMIVIGIPMLIMEFSLGHLTQQAAPNAFRRVGPRWEFVGWWPILLSFVIVTYYAAVLAWCLNYFVFSFQDPAPWKEDANAFYFDSYLQFSGSLLPGGIRPEIFYSLATVWVLMFLCIFRGVKLLGKLVLWLVPLPFMMLIILLVRGLTLEGAVVGLEYFLEPNWEVLKDIQVWRAAFGQVFFSMTIGFGVMVTYASYLHRKSDINNNALIIGLSDLTTSFISGVAVFATLGAMAVKTHQPVQDVVAGSVGLAFVAFPEALTHLPGSQFFSIIFFFALLVLGIDSAFSITQAALSSFLDKTDWRRTAILVALSLVGLGVGIIFSTRGGIAWLGLVDGFVNEGTWGIMFVGLVECVVLGWAFNLEKLRRHANDRSDWKIGPWWNVLIRFVIPGILGTLIVWSLVDDMIGAPLEIQTEQITQPQEIVIALQDPQNRAARHLHAQLSAEAQADIAELSHVQDWTPEQIEQLAAYLNTLLEKEVIHDEAAFAGVTLSEDTMYLLGTAFAQVPERVNRWLVQDVFSAYLVGSENVGGYFVDFRGNLRGRNVLYICVPLMILMLAVILGLWRPGNKNDTANFSI